jgi:hypothetical protein
VMSLVSSSLLLVYCCWSVHVVRYACIAPAFVSTARIGLQFCLVRRIGLWHAVGLRWFCSCRNILSCLSLSNVIWRKRGTEWNAKQITAFSNALSQNQRVRIKGSFVCFTAQRETGPMQGPGPLLAACRLPKNHDGMFRGREGPHSLALGTPQPHHFPHF